MGKTKKTRNQKGGAKERRWRMVNGELKHYTYGEWRGNISEWHAAPLALANGDDLSNLIPAPPARAPSPPPPPPERSSQKGDSPSRSPTASSPASASYAAAAASHLSTTPALSAKARGKLPAVPQPPASASYAAAAAPHLSTTPALSAKARGKLPAVPPPPASSLAPSQALPPRNLLSLLSPSRKSNSQRPIPRALLNTERDILDLINAYIPDLGIQATNIQRQRNLLIVELRGNILGHLTNMHITFVVGDGRDRSPH